MKKFLGVLMVSSLVGLGAFSTVNKAQAASLTIDPTDTFLRTYTDTTFYQGVNTVAGNTKAISLADLGLKGGDSISLNISGKFNTSVWSPGQRSDMIGVFSTSDHLLDTSSKQRVVDAVALNQQDANQYDYTQNTWTSNTLFNSTASPSSTFDPSKNAYMCSDATLSDPNRVCGQQTLFDGVFGIFGKTTLTIPTTATFLFLAVNDVFYSDNTGSILIDIDKIGTVDNQLSVPEPNTILGVLATIALALKMKRKQQIAK
ncbi:MAG: PEP-CTERM sorting domain-containing protein [Nostoc sp. DedVER02]|uniref:PEP-CTERM sorting domain-containing protein n=1 Tax=unclassified Nostoc TaxID=2593658 RepID=UPI002AD3AB7C|nr:MULTISPECIES: PEP-CTERM sorting domain-containing protein [unclassified Nostoc]MDZ7986794.1 PEP-CTERM sorting domain-containing protein [Nostoc sp. DedVER02]MDZ8115696.1 PEP-CTERM sorting domain-containing protein [Nostoc sp. DedVER01b]